MSKILKLIFSDTAKNTSVLFLGNIFGAILAVLFTIIAARGLGPEGWGIISAVISVITIGEAIGDLGLSGSLYKFVSKHLNDGNTESAKHFQQVTFLMRLVSSGLIFFVLTVFSKFFSQVFFKSDEWFLSFISGLGIFSYLMLDFQLGVLQAKNKWAKAAVLLTLVNLIRLIGVGFFFFTESLTLNLTLWMYSGTALVAYIVSLFWEPVMWKVTSPIKQSMKDIFGFAGWLGLNRTSGAIASRIDALLILNIVGAYQTGLYGAARQLSIGVPMLIGSLASVLAPRFATLGKEHLTSYFKKTILLSIVLSVGLVAGIFISPWVIGLFGDKYKESVEILQWLLVGYIPFVLATPAVNILIYAHHKPQVIGILSLLQIPLVWGISMYLIPNHGVWGAVMAHIGWNLSTLFVAYAFVAYYLYKKI